MKVVHTLSVVIILLATTARADIITLTNGGRLEGKAAPADETSKTTLVIDLAVGGKLTIPRTQVAGIDIVSPTEAEYQKLAQSSPDTAEDHWKLAEWCRQHKLDAEYKKHAERVLELDPNHADARNVLGFRQKDGKW